MTLTRPALAPRTSRAGPPVNVEKSHASRIAFLGSAQVSNEAGETVVVRALCWPTIPTAWIELTQALHAVRTGRGKPSPHIPADKTPTWLGTCAPQLAAPFCGALTAEESSIASLLTRTSMFRRQCGSHAPCW